MIIAIILLILVACLFAIGLTFALLAKDNRDEAYCYLYKMQTNVMFGNKNDKGESFVGFRSLTKATSGFASEIT